MKNSSRFILHASEENYFLNTEDPSACEGFKKQSANKPTTNFQIPVQNRYEGKCAVCGEDTEFIQREYALREGYRCKNCRSSLRHRCQAQAILKTIAPGIESIAELSTHESLKRLCMYEPGITGPFRKHLKNAKLYTNSYYYPELKLGESRDGVRNENLECLTFSDNSYDLVITSDILEHIRNPYTAFKEVNRILKPDAPHIFTIPMLHPLQKKTVVRVDTSGIKDVHLIPPHYHIAGDGGKSLVYNDFGLDLMDIIQSQTNAKVKIFDFEPELNTAPAEVKRVMCFIATKT